MRRHHMLRYYILFAVLFVFVAVYFLLFGRTASITSPVIDDSYHSSVQYPSEPVTLRYWRVFDASSAMNDIIADYQKLHPNVTVQVEELSPGNYLEKLSQAQASGNLPDLFSIRSDRLASWQSQLSTAPTEVFTQPSYEKAFAPILQQDLARGDKIYGVAYSLPSLGLYYNQDIFASAGVKDPPKSWQELLEVLPKVTQKNGQNLLQAGLAAGTENVRNSVDILSVLITQNGAHMTDLPPTRATYDQADSDGYNPGAKALSFYTSFANPGKSDYTYSDGFGDSLSAFAAGRVAMMLEYPYRIADVKARNPSLRFGTALLPQLSSDKPTNYGQLTAEVVNAKSKYPQIAWDFLGFASSRAELDKYLKATGRVSSRLDLAKGQESDQLLGPFAKQVPTATNWYKGYDPGVADQALRGAIGTNRAGFDPAVALRLSVPVVTAEIQKK